MFLRKLFETSSLSNLSGVTACVYTNNSHFYIVYNTGLTPQCAIIVGTVRALKMHGGGPKVSGNTKDVFYWGQQLQPKPVLVDLVDLSQ